MTSELPNGIDSKLSSPHVSKLKMSFSVCWLTGSIWTATTNFKSIKSKINFSWDYFCYKLFWRKDFIVSKVAICKREEMKVYEHWLYCCMIKEVDGCSILVHHGENVQVSGRGEKGAQGMIQLRSRFFLYLLSEAALSFLPLLKCNKKSGNSCL